MKQISVQPTPSRFSSQSPPTRNYYAALDGFRGSLSLVVAAYHTIWLSNVNNSPFLNNGPVIIDMFFALSGFLMFMLYGDKLVDFKSALTFMKRRFARLYPLHLFTLILVLLYTVLRLVLHSAGIAEQEMGEILPFHSGALEGWGSLTTNLLLIHSLGLHDGLTFNAPSWTISVEFFTYGIFALLMLFLKPRTALHFGLLAIVSLLIYFGLSKVKPNMDITNDFGAFRCFAGFMIGGTAFFVHNRLKPFYLNLTVTMRTLIELVTITVSTLFVIYWSGKLQFFVGPVIFWMILVFSFDGGFLSKILGTAPFRYLAKISYSTYMMHFIIAIGFNIFAQRVAPNLFGPNWNLTGFGGDALLVPYLLVVIGVSHFTQIYVETKGGRYVSKLLSAKPSSSCTSVKIAVTADHEQRTKA